MKRPPGPKPAPGRPGARSPGDAAPGEETRELSSGVVQEAQKLAARLGPRPAAELHPGEATHQLPGGSVRDAVADAVRALEARGAKVNDPEAARRRGGRGEPLGSAVPRKVPRAERPLKDESPVPELGADDPETVGGALAPRLGSTEPRRDTFVPGRPPALVVSGLDGGRGGRPRIGVTYGDVQIPLDPRELRRVFRTPAELATNGMLLGEAFRRATGATREEVTDYLARLFAGTGDAELGRAALLELSDPVGALDVYPLEVVVHLLDRYPWFLPTAGFGHLFTGRASRGGRIELDARAALLLEYPDQFKIRSLAVVGGARPGVTFTAEGPGRHRLAIEQPGTYGLLVSATGRAGHLVVDRLAVTVRASDGSRAAPDRSRDLFPPRDAAKVAAWPVPPVPEIDVQDLLDAPAARPEPTLLSYGELIARKSKLTAPLDPRARDDAPAPTVTPASRVEVDPEEEGDSTVLLDGAVLGPDLALPTPPRPAPQTPSRSTPPREPIREPTARDSMREPVARESVRELRDRPGRSGEAARGGPSSQTSSRPSRGPVVPRDPSSMPGFMATPPPGAGPPPSTLAEVGALSPQAIPRGRDPTVILERTSAAPTPQSHAPRVTRREEGRGHPRRSPLPGFADEPADDPTVAIDLDDREAPIDQTRRLDALRAQRARLASTADDDETSDR